MNHPIIGISGSHNVADRQMFVRENYMQSVLRAGGIPVLLPEVEDEATAKAMIDHLDGLLHILTCFIMNRDNISTALYKFINIAVWILKHQMYIQNQIRDLTDRFQNRHTKRNAWHEGSIHHVQVQVFCSTSFYPRNFLLQVFKICSQKGR